MRLQGFLENGKSLTGFLFNAIKASKSRLLYSLVKNRRREVSDSPVDYPQIIQDFNQARPDDNREILKQAFLLLWKSNSQRAYIYFLRRKLELPSKEIGDLLDMTDNNVDVVLKRAECEMRNILEELGFKNEDLYD